MKVVQGASEALERLVSTDVAAELLGFQPQTLRKWRCVGGGPKFVRAGRGRGARCRYRLADLIVWADQRTYSNTTEADCAAEVANG